MTDIKDFIKKYVSKWMVDDGNNTLLWKDKAPTVNEFLDFLAEAGAEEKARVFGEVKKYQELIMAVEKKYEGESRHETALKYIRSAEKNDYRPDGGNGGGPGVGHNNGGGYGSCSRCLGALGLNGPLGVPKCRCGPLKY